LVAWWLGGLAPISYSPQVIWIYLWSSWEPGVSDFCCRVWNLTSSKFRSTNPFLQIKCVLLWLSWELVAVVYVMQGLELWCHYVSLWDIKVMADWKTGNKSVLSQSLFFPSSTSISWCSNTSTGHSFISKICQRPFSDIVEKLAGNFDRWCSDSCPLKAKHTDTIFNVVRQTA
jgi:hypothetical protein